MATLKNVGYVIVSYVTGSSRYASLVNPNGPPSSIGVTFGEHERTRDRWVLSYLFSDAWIFDSKDLAVFAYEKLSEMWPTDDLTVCTVEALIRPAEGF